MSRTKMSWEEALAVGFFDCDYCHAKPGDWCVTRRTWNGSAATNPKWSVFLHGNRTWVVRAARWAGSTDARVMDLENLIYSITEVDERWRWTTVDQIVTELRRQLVYAREWRDQAIRDAYPD